MRSNQAGDIVEWLPDTALEPAGNPL